ncbi:hypothetical protein SBA1_170048 [Candidatus Sulfotelmatobacter kueseliae]|uniref:Uncharacterized protein n=1 Tax=Candidatus Sulfotelmatobacter kueseliae TaxID=2042962 RepID=A0A2U3KB91_9BACT|nr:hypothetical protein SBA1_170048 [Candidatus Sulfotelmatobacter kueseliae]
MAQAVWGRAPSPVRFFPVIPSEARRRTQRTGVHSRGTCFSFVIPSEARNLLFIFEADAFCPPKDLVLMPHPEAPRALPSNDVPRGLRRRGRAALQRRVSSPQAATSG